MRYLRWVIPVAAVLTAAACSTYFFPGRCDKTSDCQSMAGYAGYVCDLDPDVQGDGHCVPPCNTSSDCFGGRVCNFDSQGVGRCLFPGDGGVAGAGGGQAGAGVAGGGAGGSVGGGPGGMAGGGAGGSAGAAGSRDAGMDVNPCNACTGSTPVCLNQSCVECSASSDCTASPTKPICDQTSHKCVPCTSDSQCSAKLGSTGNPGVCRSELDGHCATDAETIYVQNTTGCTTVASGTGAGGAGGAGGTAGTAGTGAVPYCSMEPVAAAALSPKTLVVIRGTVAAPDWSFSRGQSQPETLFVGQQSAVIASSTTPGFNLASGAVYIRNVAFSSSAAICIEATGGTLNLSSVVVDSCKGGGIFLDGAAFDIEETAVTNNSLAQLGATSWSGIIVNSLAASGPMTLNLVTIQNNKGPGLECAKAISGTGVLASGNGAPDIGGTCNVSSCGSASATCGAQ
jgi:hypothetical protein